jgi:hypothetical protein
MPPSVDSPYGQLEEILLGDGGRRIRRLDRDMTTRPPLNTLTILTTNSSRLVSIGPIITTTDRELRRAVAILGSEPPVDEPSYAFGTQGRRPRPISPNAGGLRVYGAGAGSLHLLVEAYGDVLALLLSKPVSALVTLSALGHVGAILRVWLNRPRRDELGRTNADQTIDALKRSGDSIPRMLHDDRPDYEIDVNPSQDGELSVVQEDRVPYAEESPILYTVPPTATVHAGKYEATIHVGDIEARGRQITHTRTYSNGTQDIIHIES